MRILNIEAPSFDFIPSSTRLLNRGEEMIFSRRRWPRASQSDDARYFLRFISATAATPDTPFTRYRMPDMMLRGRAFLRAASLRDAGDIAEDRRSARKRRGRRRRPRAAIACCRSSPPQMPAELSFSESAFARYGLHATTIRPPAVPCPRMVPCTITLLTEGRRSQCLRDVRRAIWKYSQTKLVIEYKSVAERLFMDYSFATTSGIRHHVIESTKVYRHHTTPAWSGGLTTRPTSPKPRQYTPPGSGIPPNTNTPAPSEEDIFQHEDHRPCDIKVLQHAVVHCSAHAHPQNRVYYTYTTPAEVNVAFPSSATPVESLYASAGITKGYRMDNVQPAR